MSAFTSGEHVPPIVGIVAASAEFGRDLAACWATVERILREARAAGASLVVLPEAALGGYLADLSGGAQDLPPAFERDGAELAHLTALAGDLVVCAGYCEADGAARYNSAVCVGAGRILGHHRKVHQPLGENRTYAAGGEFGAFDTPVGRIALQICYDKAFPEGARSQALDGARIIASLSAWPASRTDPAPDLMDDRWTRRFDLFDQARALDNQVVWVAANQSGTFGSLRFVGRAKIVGPGGEVIAATGTGPGLAVAHVDVAAALAGARRSIYYLRDRRPDAYAPSAAMVEVVR